MAATLPINVTAKGTGHPGLHNAVNAAVNEHDARIAALEAGGGTGTGGQGPQGVGVASITDTDGDGVATVTLHDPRTGTDSTSSLPLPRGLKGDPGTPGAPGKDGTTPATPAFTATATTLAAGSAATAAVSGTYPALTLALGIPRGADGSGGSGGGGTSSQITGAGRPDVTSTMTSDVQAQVAAAPVGTTFISTDGASVKAWAWLKLPTGWQVTVGDTDWRTIAVPDDAGGTWTDSLYLKRKNDRVLLRVAAPNGNPNSSFTLPQGFRPDLSSYDGRDQAIVPGRCDGNCAPRAAVAANASGRLGWWADGGAPWVSGTFQAETQWPTTLPGNPAS